jgi:hypothetical protein
MKEDFLPFFWTAMQYALGQSRTSLSSALIYIVLYSNDLSQLTFLSVLYCCGKIGNG